MKLEEKVVKWQKTLLTTNDYRIEHSFDGIIKRRIPFPQSVGVTYIKASLTQHSFTRQKSIPILLNPEEPN